MAVLQMTHMHAREGEQKQQLDKEPVQAVEEYDIKGIASQQCPAHDHT